MSCSISRIKYFKKEMRCMAEKILSVGADVLIVDNDLRTITIPTSISHVNN